MTQLVCRGRTPARDSHAWHPSVTEHAPHTRLRCAPARMNASPTPAPCRSPSHLSCRRCIRLLPHGSPSGQLQGTLPAGKAPCNGSRIAAARPPPSPAPALTPGRSAASPAWSGSGACHGCMPAPRSPAGGGHRHPLMIPRARRIVGERPLRPGLVPYLEVGHARERRDVMPYTAMRRASAFFRSERHPIRSFAAALSGPRSRCPGNASDRQAFRRSAPAHATPVDTATAWRAARPPGRSSIAAAQAPRPHP